MDTVGLTAVITHLIICETVLSYSQTTASALEVAIHLGIAYTVTATSGMDQRDVLVQDFEVVETVFFPRFVHQP